MASVSPIANSVNSSVVVKTADEKPQAQPALEHKSEKKIIEYPLTYDQYKSNKMISSSFGALLIGGLTSCIMKLSKFNTKSSVFAGSLIAAGSAVTTIIMGLNGKFKLGYVQSKQRFENYQDFKAKNNLI